MVTWYNLNFVLCHKLCGISLGFWETAHPFLTALCMSTLYTRQHTVADPDLQIRRGEGGGGLKKTFSALRASVWSKANRWPPLEPSLVYKIDWKTTPA